MTDNPRSNIAGAPGPNNDITDVAGIRVGQAQCDTAITGVSVIIPDAPAICAGDIRGGGPGTRETDLLDPSTLVETADAIVLSGGSSYGLGAADGVAAWLGANGRGFSLVNKDGVPPSPIVPAAILYDLANGGDKMWGLTPPYRDLGLQACNELASPFLQGRAGAGFGASAGAEAGGVGSASYVLASGLAVGAFMAVNSFGSVRMPGERAFWAWPFEQNGEFGGMSPAQGPRSIADLPPDTKLAAAARANTTIGGVATNAKLTQAQAKRVAIMAQDGLARAIRPVHAPTDGDVIFCLATGTMSAADQTPNVDPLTLTRIGSIAADCVARAIARGVFEANRTVPNSSSGF
ncbi:MAG: P1 family peptidase [Pseudomonadota bacterium]